MLSRAGKAVAEELASDMSKGIFTATRAVNACSRDGPRRRYWKERAVKQTGNTHGAFLL